MLHLAFGGVLGSAAWLIPRRVAAAGPTGFSLLLDLSPVILAGGLLLLATGRPILSGFVLLALGAGFALADKTKRRTLREPVVFTEMSELRHVFTHPHLYLPFAGSALVIAGTVAAIAAVALLLLLEPELWEPDPGLLLGMLCLVGAGGWMASRWPLLNVLATAMRCLHPAGEPFADAARLGPFAMILAYGTIPRAERSARRTRHLASPALGLVERSAADVPVVVVQCESFFDARRLSPLVPEGLLSGFDACCKAGATYGRLEVSAWGANTMRAEFAVLTGIPEDDLGYDRFNPYHAFARVPLRSLVWQLRGEGYQTVCLHPFDRGFFGRDRILPALGFETFLGRESLGGSRRPPYFSDPDLALQVLRALDAAGPRVFVFAITMGNHGPWFEAEHSVDADLRGALDPKRLPQGGELLRYLHGLRRSDQMLQILMDGLAGNGSEGILAFYGDHLPSLPHAFEHFGFAEWGSDYVLWRSDPSPSRRIDLPAYRLPGVIIDTLREKGAIGLPDASSRFEHRPLPTGP